MTDREKAIIMAYTGISMLSGDKIDEFYKYLSELYGRPVYTHEIITLDIEHKSKPDFLKLCEEEQPEQHWIPCSKTFDIPDHEIMACDRYGNFLFGYLTYEDDQWLCESDGEMMYNPIAWSEKPEPYREDGEADG